MGYATLGYAGGPNIAFRVDPNSVSWNWQINTSVTPTVGGRVIQVTGATLSDLTISGLFGQDHGGSGDSGSGWRQAENFAKVIADIMVKQSQPATTEGKMPAPPVFNYSPKGWRFGVYVKDLSDPSGGGNVTHTAGKISYGYTLTLFIDTDMSDAPTVVGKSNGVLEQQKSKALAEYFARISDGIGWHFSQYNGPTTQGLLPSDVDQTTTAKQKQKTSGTDSAGRTVRNGKTFPVGQ